MDALRSAASRTPGMMYGAVKGKAQSLPVGLDLWRVPHRRMPRLTCRGVLSGLLIPVLFFAVLCAAVCSKQRYQNSWFCPLMCLLGFAVLGIMFALLWRKWFTVDREGYALDPTWRFFVLVTSVGAFFAAIIVGNRIYENTIEPYHAIVMLDTYAGVDPSTMHGRSYMDAGRIEFSEDSWLDIDKSMDFMNVDDYCVVPIVRGTQLMPKYDFWAVGLNCCDRDKKDPRRPQFVPGLSGPFECGQYKNTAAHQGMRLMRSDQREFFRLAVQEATAAYGIKTDYPLFFYWEEDVDKALRQYLTDAARYYVMAVTAHVCVQALLLLLVVILIGVMTA